MNKLVSSCLIALTVLSTVGSAQAADTIKWKVNKNFFPQFKQAYCGGSTCQSRTDAALRKACPKGLDEMLTDTDKCGDVIVKFVACKQSRMFRKVSGHVYMALCTDDEATVRKLMGK